MICLKNDGKLLFVKKNCQSVQATLRIGATVVISGVQLPRVQRRDIKTTPRAHVSDVIFSKFPFQSTCKGAQWLSGRVLDSRPRAAGSSLTGVTALWSLSKTHLS